MDANHNQSLENASIFILLYKQRNTTGIAPNRILKKAIVIGPYEYVAILMLKKADAHIKDNIDRSR